MARWSLIEDPTVRVLLKDFAEFCKRIGGELSTTVSKGLATVSCIVPSRSVSVTLSRRERLASISVSVGGEKFEGYIALHPSEEIVLEVPSGGTSFLSSLDHEYIHVRKSDASAIMLTYEKREGMEKLTIVAI